MKVLILYKSIHHKNTEEIAKAIAEELNADIYDIDKDRFKETLLENFENILAEDEINKLADELYDNRT